MAVSWGGHGNFQLAVEAMAQEAKALAPPCAQKFLEKPETEPIAIALKSSWRPAAHGMHSHVVLRGTGVDSRNAKSLAMSSRAKGTLFVDAVNGISKKQSSNRGWWVAGAAASILLFLAWSSHSVGPATVTKAVAVLKGDSKATGTVTFEQGKNGVTVTGELRNLDLSRRAVSTFNLTDGCLSAGPHFNPFGKNHGAPSDTERHVGDLGNIKTDESGTASFEFKDTLISLNGPLSIVGRAVVLHAGTDDLGRGDDDESLKTGNAGARAACGVNH
ncbi:superoxide dismutase [Mycena galopus ATCC 62051]|nr:superoxide dismutase [Mycena galopus ATCC 62051]